MPPKNEAAIEIVDRSINVLDSMDGMEQAVHDLYRASVRVCEDEQAALAPMHEAFGALNAMLDHFNRQARAIRRSLRELSPPQEVRPSGVRKTGSPPDSSR